MAFENLTDRFQAVFKKMRREDRLTESNMQEALREIRIALLESDVNYKVVKAFVEDVKEKALGSAVLTRVNPSEMLIKICHDELVKLLGDDNYHLESRSGLYKIMLVGLQGTGKTTTAGKLAAYFAKKKHKKVLLVGLDVYRPAALEQLAQIADSLGVTFFGLGANAKPLEVALKAQEKARAEGYNVIIFDTAGRLQIDEPLMEELESLSKNLALDETLLLVDAMSGQDSTNVVKTFNERLHLSGVIVSKLDGDAKGGAVLSFKYLTGLPVVFIGTGEKMEDLEEFHPERLADRILGMGDVVSLVERAQEVVDEKEAERQGKKLLSGEYTLDDMLKQMKMVQKIGNMKVLSSLVPGLNRLSDEQKDKAEREMKVFETVYNSMTPYERRHPEILKFSHKNRIAKGSGLTNADINRVIRKYEQSKELVKTMKNRGGKLPPNISNLLK